MKNLKLIVAILSITLITSCESDDKIVDDVLSTFTSGAVLRTRSLEGNPYNAFVPASALSLTAEAQNGRAGTTLESIDLYVSFTDNQDDPVDVSKAESLFANYPAAGLTPGSRGLDELAFNTTLAESATFLGLSDTDYSGGDVFSYRFVMKLSDGTEWTDVNGNGNITGGSYFSSPYRYNITVSCIPVAPIAGDYVLAMQDSYGDGWNGASIRLTLDGVATDYSITGSSGSETITVPASATSWKWEFISGDWDSEITFDITAPNGKEAYADGPSPFVGELVLNICP